ncbi:50S ribosomal protein L25 [Alkaliphilus crotonatoxidans]
MDLINSGVRSSVGKNNSHRIRHDGYIPAVIYAKDMNTLPVKINKKEAESFIRTYGETGMLQVNIGDQTYSVVIKEIQRDPVTREIIHLDLQRINQNDKIHVKVPIVLTGRNYVEKSGVILQQQLNEVEVECYAGSIPQKLVFDISNFRTGDALRIADMEVGEEFHIIQDPQSIIASVTTIGQEKNNEETEQK